MKRILAPVQLDNRWLPLLVGLYAFSIAVWPLIAGIEVTVEDGFYYLKIAENVVNGAGSTFDGEHATNGYHPLWLLVLIPLTSLAGSMENALLAAKLLQAGLAALAAAGLYAVGRTLASGAASAAGVLLWIEFSRRLWLEGLELALHTAVLVAVLLFWSRRFGGELSRSSVPYALLGTGCAVAFLVRLDTLLLAVVLGITLGLALVRRGLDSVALARLAAFALPVGLVVLIYAAINFELYGHPTPVSGSIKREWSATLLASDAFYQENGWVAAKTRVLVRPLVIGWGHPNLRPVAFGLTTIGGWLLLLVWQSRNGAARQSEQRLRTLLPWACYGVLSYLVYGLTYHGVLSATPRYYVVQPIIAALLVAIAIDWILGQRLHSRRRAVIAGLAATLMLVTQLGLRQQIRRERHGPGQPLVNAARKVEHELPADARLAAWNAGTVAFLGKRQVINLDGLVNSWDFFERERHDLCSYLRHEGVSHIVDLFRNGETRREVLPMAPVVIDLPCADQLELLWLDERYSPDWSVRAYRLPASRRSPEDAA